MVLFTLLIILTIIVLVVLSVFLISTCGVVALFILPFLDIIVFVWILKLLKKFFGLFKRKNKKEISE